MLRILRAAADPVVSCSTQKLLSAVIGGETMDLPMPSVSAPGKPEANLVWSDRVRGERPDLLIAAQRLVARNAAAVSRARIRWRDIVPGFDGQRPDADSESFVLCCMPSHHAARMNRGPGGSAFSRISSVWKRLRVNRHLRRPMDCRPPGRWPAGWRRVPPDNVYRRSGGCRGSTCRMESTSNRCRSVGAGTFGANWVAPQRPPLRLATAFGLTRFG